MRKMRTSLPPQENKCLRRFCRTKLWKMQTRKRGQCWKCGWLVLNVIGFRWPPNKGCSLAWPSRPHAQKNRKTRKMRKMRKMKTRKMRKMRMTGFNVTGFRWPPILLRNLALAPLCQISGENLNVWKQQGAIHPEILYPYPNPKNLLRLFYFLFLEVLFKTSPRIHWIKG